MLPFAVFSPGLAAGAAVAAVSVPILIHLLFRKRYQIVPWAAIRFLLLAERRHRRRIDQWILLALRTLTLLLPLFAMIAASRWAEPLWQAIKPGTTETIANVPRTHHVIVLDASLSMTAHTADGRTRFEKAVAQAENLLERSRGSGDGFTLLVLAGGGDPRVVSGPANDIDKVLAELKAVKPTHATADTTSVLGTIADILVHSPRAYPRRQVTFLTDLQRSAWANAIPKADATAPDLWQRIVGRADVVVLDVARSDLDNLAVASVTLADSLPFVDSPGVASAVIANLGRTEKRDVQVQLLLGRPGSPDSLASVEQQRIKTLGAGERATVTFGSEGQIRFREKGIHVLQVKLLEPDELPADDSRSLAVQVREGLNVILVDGKPDPDYFRRAAGYLFRALYPPNAKPSDTPIRPRTMTPSEFIDPIAGDLTGVDCVYLCDVGTITSDLALKLDSVLKRGGAVVIGLGPNAAGNRLMYNQLLYNDGNGLLPGPLGDVVTAGANDLGFRLIANEEDYRKPPLTYFQNERIRGGFLMPPFHSYIRLDAPTDARARRILSFVPAGNPASAPNANRKPDPAFVEWTRHHGRVVVYTSSFNEDWNNWASYLWSYLPFQHEFVRFVATNPDRHTVQVGETIEEFYPPAAAGLIANVVGPETISGSVTLAMQDESGVARFPNTRLSGLYRMRLEGHADRVFAVNPPELAPNGSESDLKRIDPAELRSLGSGVQVVPDVGEIRPTTDSGAVLVSAPKPHGPMIARFAIMAALLVFTTELLLAWRWGPARAAGAGTASGSLRAVERKFYVRVLSTAGALIPLVAAVAILGTLIHYERTGNLLGFLSPEARASVEDLAGVPTAQPGEGTKWRLEGLTSFVRNGSTDRRIVQALAILAIVLTIAVYRLERRAVSGVHRLVVPGLLRLSVFLLALFVLLPQLKLMFDREGWPEVVILIDTSGSMGHIDEFKDSVVRAKAEELAALNDLPAGPHRLALARLLLTHKDGPWLERLLKEKEVKVHIYTVDSTTRNVASLYEPEDIPTANKALRELVWDNEKNDKKGGYRDLGNESKLGDGVESVLKTFRGGSLAAIIMLTDGVTTSGDDLPKAAREAARAGVPLYLIGVGDAWEVPDLALTDLNAEDTVTVGEELVFDARLVARGQIPPNPVTVALYEKGRSPDSGKRITVTPNPNGNPVPVVISHIPTEPGEKTLVLEVQTAVGETDITNNRLERTVLVTDSKRVRVLLIEGYPRYDFRFVKVLLERESERSLGGKGFAIEVLLLNAPKDWARTDKSAEPLRGDFPTREQLFGYDVVILGDVDPKQIPRATGALQNLADFVKQKGGGLMFLSGEHGTPAVYADTPLADVLPVTPDPLTGRPVEENAISEGFRPRITRIGRQHPLFRFSPEDAEAQNIWNRLQPLYWFAKGYRRKPNTLVLAEHPDRAAEGGPSGENHPLVIQSFAGAGPVMFLGFDDTWRWRFRNDEEHFDRFWMQAMRVLARSRVRRIELKVEPKVDFRRDEKMTVIARFPVEAPAPPAGQPVRVNLARGPLPNRDGTPGTGPTETSTLTLARVSGPGVQYATVVTRTPEGEYRFTLTDPETQPGMSPPSAVARVLPPLNETDRVHLNKSDLASAAALSNGGFYTLATADKVFEDLKNLQRVPLNQPCPPVELWNHPLLYLLLTLLLAAEWLLRKRERLL